MITCQLIQVSRNQNGAKVRNETLISGEFFQVGRGAGCALHLADHRADLHHATIRRAIDGAIFIECEHDSTIRINEFIEQSGALSEGTVVEVGPYQLLVEQAPDGCDIAIAVEMTHLPPELSAAGKSKDYLTLAALGLSKRKISLILVAVLMFAFLLLPILPRISSAFDSWQAALPVTLTDSWSPGELSGGHRVFGSKCSACHQTSFKAISDEACKSCHKNVVQHVADKILHDREFKNIRCTDCHSDHKGNRGLVKHDANLCVKCHGDLRSVKVGTPVADVRGFSTAHPEFRLSVRDAKDGDHINRIRQSAQGEITEVIALKYSHKVHLDKNGISTPGGDVVMVCHDCHKLDESGKHFVPMTLKKTCQQSGCHAIYFKEPAEGKVPHGSEHDVMDKLRAFYTRWLTIPNNRVLCGQLKESNKVLSCADTLALNNAATSLFKDKVGCGECHEIKMSSDTETPWKIVPVRINRDWHSGAMFPHVKHGAMDCDRCHDKIHSTNSADVSMPRIEKCRECHVGDETVKGKITSYCNRCHRYHVAN